MILDVGSADVNGTLRDCAPPGCVYLGVDVAAGPGVDIVLEDVYRFPFSDGYFDRLVCTSCLEHDQLFWLTFLEMVRVVRPNGYIYVNAPSNGDYHAYPFDNWRFYPDSALALSAWAKRNGQELALVESFIARRRRDQWNDCVMVFFRGAENEIPVTRLMSDSFDRYFNLRTFRASVLSRFSERTEDMLLIEHYRDGIDHPDILAEAAAGAPEVKENGGLDARFDTDEVRIGVIEERLRSLSVRIEAAERLAAHLSR
jgi:SAM-dependent methyltransferase